MDNEVRKRNVGDSVISKEQVIDFKNVNFFFFVVNLSLVATTNFRNVARVLREL